MHYVAGPLSTVILSSLGDFNAPCNRPTVHGPPFQFGRLHRAVCTPPVLTKYKILLAKSGDFHTPSTSRDILRALFLFSRLTHFSLQFSLGAYDFLSVYNILRIVSFVCVYILDNFLSLCLHSYSILYLLILALLRVPF